MTDALQAQIRQDEFETLRLTTQIEMRQKYKWDVEKFATFLNKPLDAVARAIFYSFILQEYNRWALRNNLAEKELKPRWTTNRPPHDIDGINEKINGRWVELDHFIVADYYNQMTQFYLH